MAMDNETFDAGYYLLVHGDVEDSAMDPRAHFEQFGRREHRSGTPPALMHPSERELHDRWEFFLRAFSVLAHNQISGDYVEFGTGRGSTLWCAHRAGQATTPRRLWSFDSFSGLPRSSSPVDDHPAWPAGAFSQPLAAVRQRLSKAGVEPAEVRFVEGFFSQTLAPARRADLPRDVALAYVDCDLHQSTVEVLDYLRTVLKHGMVLAFDDYCCWSAQHLSGEQVAFESWGAGLKEFRFHPFLPIGWHGRSFYVERK
jgi:hypothetical protein